MPDLVATEFCKLQVAIRPDDHILGMAIESWDDEFSEHTHWSCTSPMKYSESFRPVVHWC